MIDICDLEGGGKVKRGPDVTNHVHWVHVHLSQRLTAPRHSQALVKGNLGIN
jgi:hypothetical protein